MSNSSKPAPPIDTVTTKSIFNKFISNLKGWKRTPDQTNQMEKAPDKSAEPLHPPAASFEMKHVDLENISQTKKESSIQHLPPEVANMEREEFINNSISNSSKPVPPINTVTTKSIFNKFISNLKGWKRTPDQTNQMEKAPDKNAEPLHSLAASSKMEHVDLENISQTKKESSIQHLLPEVANMEREEFINNSISNSSKTVLPIDTVHTKSIFDKLISKGSRRMPDQTKHMKKAPDKNAEPLHSLAASSNMEHVDLEHISENKKESSIQHLPLEVTNMESQKFIDADTHWSNHTYQINRTFVGKPRSPAPSDLRHHVYNTFILNPISRGANNPFILQSTYQTLQLERVPHLERKNQSIFSDYNQAGDGHYFCRIQLTLTPHWQALPSAFPDEELQQFYLSCPDEVDIKKSNQTSLYYICLKQSDVLATKNVTFEMLLFHPKPVVSFNDLPDMVRALVKDCRGYRNQDLQSISSRATAHDYLLALIKQRTGSCRHRSVVFKYRMQQEHPNIPVRLITNDNHIYVEVFYKNQWISCNLGGYEAKTHINENTISEQGLYLLNNHDIEPSERYNVKFSDQGFRYVDLNKTRNITKLHLVQLTYFPEKDLSLLDTLDITTCTISANKLLTLLKKAPNLKTLILAHCVMDDEQFQLLDFSMLKQLEHVTLTGHFVPDANAVMHLIRTAPENTQWVIETDHIEQLNDRELNERIVIKHISRKLPEHRYFPSNAPIQERQQLELLLSADWETGLINTTQATGLRLMLQQQCKHINRASYYVHTPEELQCNRPFIQRDGSAGTICKGPGGPLYNFFMAEHQHPILIINYNTFKPADLARFNSLLDSERIIDEVMVPNDCKIIGLLDFSDPNVYQGRDFYSRFQHEEEFNHTLPVAPPILSSKIAIEQLEHSQQIELCGGQDWEARLIGHWMLQGNQLIFQEGCLLQGIANKKTSFVLNNAPLDDPDFIRFLQDMKLHQGVYHQGRLLLACPEDFQLSFTQQISFPDNTKWVMFNVNSSSLIDKHCHLLNSTNLSQFFGIYQCDEVTQGIVLHKGLIEQYQGQILPVYVTSTLTSYSWLNLSEHCLTYQTQLQLTLAPGVKLPNDLTPATPVLTQILSKSNATVLHIGHIHDAPLNFNQKKPMIINISELHTDDLMQGIACKFDNETLSFKFSPIESFLCKALCDNHTVILHGKWSLELAEAMHPIIFNRLQAEHPKGQLILLSDESELFSLLPGVKLDATHVNKKNVIDLIAEYEERFDTVNNALKTHPMVRLTGETGVGKTHFISSDWQKKHPACHYGEEHIINWILDTSLGIKTLFIDEANISHKHWSEFTGLYHEQPGIFYLKQYYPLTKEHKVIFAGNPLSYGGERQEQALFQEHPSQIQFKPLPAQVIAKNLDLDIAVVKPILDVVEYMSHINPPDALITPREIMMMAYLTKAAKHHQPTVELVDFARYFAYTLVKSYVPVASMSGFNDRFMPKNSPNLSIHLTDFVINNSNRDAVTGLSYHLVLRQHRCNGKGMIPSVGGLGGVVLEGEPGIGKSDLVKQILIAYGLQKGHDFFHLPISFSQKNKEDILLRAFHEGSIVIIDEINSAPMLERLLNALLEGHDLKGKPAKNPGFMLIGTQNPITFHGRIKTTLPMKHRLQTIQMSNYNKHEMLDIIQHMGLPRRIAHDMLGEFLKHQQQNPTLCFRDLLMSVKKWQRSHPEDLAITLNLTPIKQVGSLCKTVAIANVDNYYAQILDYQPVPLWSRQIMQPSVRKLVKANGSSQGEILEYTQWEKDFNDLGFDTESVDFKDNIGLFIKSIVSHLKIGNLPVIAFAVNLKLGLPDPAPNEPHEREHAAVITGYNPKTDELLLAHWGSVYTVDLLTLFHASCALPETRKQEFYGKNMAYTSNKKDEIKKYLPVDAEDTHRMLNSIVPRDKSGFNAKLLIIKKPEKSTLLQKRTTLFAQLQSTYKFFKSHESPTIGDYPESVVRTRNHKNG